MNIIIVLVQYIMVDFIFNIFVFNKDAVLFKSYLKLTGLNNILFGSFRSFCTKHIGRL